MQTDAARSQLAHKLEEARPATRGRYFPGAPGGGESSSSAATAASGGQQQPLQPQRVGGKLQPQTVFHRRPDKQAASCEGVWCR